ncbi:cytochrome c [Geobacter sp. FeAm09]|nr:cytochrome c [Geobacter sp. FeAm09]
MKNGIFTNVTIITLQLVTNERVYKMNSSKMPFLIVLLVAVMMIAGCGEDKTIYENGSTGSSTTTPDTPTTPTDTTLDGPTLFQTYCSKCHKTTGDPYGIKWSTLTSIPANMQFELSDAQLKALVTYFGTLQ